jgi:hypothetical protein
VRSALGFAGRVFLERLPSPPCLSRLAQRFDTLFVDPREVLLPAHVLAPDKGRLDCGPWKSGICKHIECKARNRSLHVRLVGAPARISEWEVAEEKARYAALFNDVARAANDDGCNAVGFEVSCDQTHGLVADGSQWDKQRHVYRVFATTAENLGRIVFDRAALAVVGGDAVKARRNAADASFFCKGL